MCVLTLWSEQVYQYTSTDGKHDPYLFDEIIFLIEPPESRQAHICSGTIWNPMLQISDVESVMLATVTGLFH